MELIATQQERPWDRPFWKPVHGKEGVFAYLVLIHVLAVVGLILFPVPSLKVVGMTLLSIAFGGLGTTVCYHRMLAHKTLKTNRVIEQVLIFWAVFNGSGHPASWVAYHRLHHSTTDTPDDVPAQNKEASGGRTCAGSIKPLPLTVSGGVLIWIVAFTKFGVIPKRRSLCYPSSLACSSGSDGRASSGWARFAWSTRCTFNAW